MCKLEVKMVLNYLADEPFYDVMDRFGNTASNLVICLEYLDLCSFEGSLHILKCINIGKYLFKM